MPFLSPQPNSKQRLAPLAVPMAMGPSTAGMCKQKLPELTVQKSRRHHHRRRCLPSRPTFTAPGAGYRRAPALWSGVSADKAHTGSSLFALARLHAPGLKKCPRRGSSGVGVGGWGGRRGVRDWRRFEGGWGGRQAKGLGNMPPDKNHAGFPHLSLGDTSKREGRP